MAETDVKLWERAEALVDRAPSVAALRAHGLHLLAARSWRARGRIVSPDLRAEEHRAAMLALAAPVVLDRARAAYGGQLMLMKGPEVARHYRDPGARAFRDLDLLVDDPPAAQRALVAAGFIEGGHPDRYARAQHLRPLAWPGLPLVVELHRRPNCPPWLQPPPTHTLLDLGVPSRAGVDGVLAPAPPVHALLLAAHGWAHRPLGRIADLIDVLAVLGSADRAAANDLALEWRWEGLWGAVIAAADALMAGQQRPASLSIWARHLERARERSVLETHLARVAAPAWALPLSGAPRSVGAALVHSASRDSEEHWADKLRRSRLAVAHALMPESAHLQAMYDPDNQGVTDDAATADR
jgi:hypothetical protein